MPIFRDSQARRGGAPDSSGQHSVIIFASNNAHKLSEVRAILGSPYIVTGLTDLGFEGDIPEPYETLEENAFAKARLISQKYGQNCFADDTGLEVEALDGLPGVHSARFAGEEKNNEANIDKLLSMLEGQANRAARFRTAIALILDGVEFLCEGIVTGKIALQRSGSNGFGYDSVFIPDGHTRSFAQMTDAEKNKLSHRFEALLKMKGLLERIED